MTYHDPDAWPPPPRTPRHANPRRSVRRRRRRSQRANPGLRGTIPWVVGLSSVVAAVAVVAAISPPRTRPGSGSSEEQSATQSLVNQQSRSSSSTTDPPSSVTPSPAAGPQPVAQRGGNYAEHEAALWHWHMMANFAGNGDVTTTTFRVLPHRKWDLRWNFHCTSTGQAGTFGVKNVSATTAGINGSTQQTGEAGRGTIVLYPDGAWNYLVVTSTCTWTVKAIQRV